MSLFGTIDLLIREKVGTENILYDITRFDFMRHYRGECEFNQMCQQAQEIWLELEAQNINIGVGLPEGVCSEVK